MSKAVLKGAGALFFLAWASAVGAAAFDLQGLTLGQDEAAARARVPFLRCADNPPALRAGGDRTCRADPQLLSMIADCAEGDAGCVAKAVAPLRFGAVPEASYALSFVEHHAFEVQVRFDRSYFEPLLGEFKSRYGGPSEEQIRQSWASGSAPSPSRVVVWTQPGSRLELEEVTFGGLTTVRLATDPLPPIVAQLRNPQRGPISAPLPQPKRYSWDNRPGGCYAPGAPQVGQCKPPDNWPSYDETVRRVGGIVQSAEPELIARAEAELAFSKQRFPTGEYYFEAWYAGMSNQLSLPSKYTADRVQAWKAAKGGADGFAVVAEALVRHSDAWAARGRGFARTVTPEGWKLFYERLAEADKLLDSASPRVKAMGSWYAAKLLVATEHPELKPGLLKLLEAASDAWPDYQPIYNIAMSAAEPRWGGDYETMDGVARFAAAKSKAGLGDGMYALVYERSLRTEGNFTLRDTKADWKLMKRAFRDLEVHPRGDVWIWRSFASLACQARDREEARRLYALYDAKRQDKGVDDASDSCRAFAAGRD